MTQPAVEGPGGGGQGPEKLLQISSRLPPVLAQRACLSPARMCTQRPN